MVRMIYDSAEVYVHPPNRLIDGRVLYPCKVRGGGGGGGQGLQPIHLLSVFSAKIFRCIAPPLALLHKGSPTPIQMIDFVHAEVAACWR